MKEVVAECCEHEGLGECPVHLAGLVNVAGGVERVEAPVPLLPHLVPGMIELGPVVGRALLDGEYVASHGQPQHQRKVLIKSESVECRHIIKSLGSIMSRLPYFLIFSRQTKEYIFFIHRPIIRSILGFVCPTIR